MKLNEVIDAIADGRGYRETGGHAPWRKGMADLAHVPPVFFKGDTWELEPEGKKIPLSLESPAESMKDGSGFSIPVDHVRKEVLLSTEDIATLYRASREPGPKECELSDHEAIALYDGKHVESTTLHGYDHSMSAGKTRCIKDAYNYGHRAGWNAAMKQIGGGV